MVIYAASPIGVFQQSFLIAAAFFVFGGLAVLVGLFRLFRHFKNWLGLAIPGIFLAAVGVVMVGITLRNMSVSPQAVTALLDKKAVVEENCEAGYNCNLDYVLSMTSAPNYYDFTVAKKTYDSMQRGQCYQVNYYPSVGLFSAPASDSAGAYVSTSYITDITQMDPGACPQ